ncbi:hypothetical protein D3C86_1817840 [compost metagenome]
MTGPCQCRRSQAMSSQHSDMSICRLNPAACAFRSLAIPLLRARLTSCGEPPWRSMRRHHRGCAARSASSRGVHGTGMRKPLRMSWSRLPWTMVSTVSIRVLKPAARARAIMFSAIERSRCT